ncbi:MAG: hypothetical protein Q9227_002629 [Pyrenula ochraceoflavens]
MAQSPSRRSPSRSVSNLEEDLDLSHRFEGLKMQEDGRITFHGPTSFFQLPRGKATSPPAPHPQDPDPGGRERLINSAWRERTFEQYRQVNEPFRYLLDSHWCWIQPLLNFVYRPAFTRDLQSNGPYYSPALYNAMLAHSVRWCKNDTRVSHLLRPYEDGGQFFKNATLGVFEDLKNGVNNIPTIQTLLLLSAQNCGRGNRTQAWLYSGMAFRLAEDMGMCIDGRKYAGTFKFTDEEIEIRNRLFWSCYLWEKILCLYLGRSATIRNSQVSPPQIMLDDTSEIEAWTPHGVEYPPGQEYTPQPARATSCFVQMCKLSEILNDILNHLYDPLRESPAIGIQSYIEEQDGRLEHWWKQLPEFLKLLPTSLPHHCPPGHIVTLNCLYHTVKILLHRPILGAKLNAVGEKRVPNPRHAMQCIFSANAIIAIFDLYRRAFGEGHVVLSLAYSVYTAASIFLLELQVGSDTGSPLEKLRFCVIILGKLREASPILEAALRLIYQEMHSMNIDIEDCLAQVNPPSQAMNPPQNDAFARMQQYHSMEGVQPAPAPIDPSIQNPHWGSFVGQDHAMPTVPDPNNVQVTAEMLEALSNYEPISANVGAGFNATSPSS